MMFALQVAAASLPNIELVSLLVAAFSVYFGRRTLAAIYVFALLEGITYGFGSWWICYLYVWTILYLVSRAAKQMQSPIGWAAILGLFGLLFGALCSIPYFFILGPAGGLSYFLGGIPYDLLHCVGNTVSGLLLWKPVGKALERIASDKK